MGAITPIVFDTAGLPPPNKFGTACYPLKLFTAGHFSPKRGVWVTEADPLWLPLIFRIVHHSRFRAKNGCLGQSMTVLDAPMWLPSSQQVKGGIPLIHCFYCSENNRYILLSSYSPFITTIVICSKICSTFCN